MVGIGVVGLVVWITVRNFHPPKAIGQELGARAHDAGEQASSAEGNLAALLHDGGPLLVSDLADLSVDLFRRDAGAAATLPDGTPVPPLPFSVPRQIRFGVVLVSYAGAQPATTGGRPAVRSHEDAKILAERLVLSAAQDFHAAVEQGDPGSADDVGRVKLGILEPAPEYVLFTLPPGGVGGPVDTPRGYWIVKRIE
jgi:hypothetical protein